MKVAVSGARGLIGAALCTALRARGDEVVEIGRGPDGPGRVHWNPQTGELDVTRLAGTSAVVHLAGESVFGRWTPAKQHKIRASRVDGTRLLTQRLGDLGVMPRVFVCASAVGYYGHDGGPEPLTEHAPNGTDFLSEVVAAWEAACQSARDVGIRVANARFGVVVSAAGGALGTALTPFRLGLGGRLGSGRQWMSWIHIDDAVRVLLAMIDSDDLAGAFNVCAPEPVTNARYTRAIRAALRRPAILPIPALVLRLAFGDMSIELLGSMCVVPQRLADAGFDFLYPQIEGAVAHALGAA